MTRARAPKARTAIDAISTVITASLTAGASSTERHQHGVHAHERHVRHEDEREARGQGGDLGEQGGHTQSGEPGPDQVANGGTGHAAHLAADLGRPRPIVGSGDHGGRLVEEGHLRRHFPRRNGTGRRWPRRRS